jgi:hypothetical protein
LQKSFIAHLFKNSILKKNKNKKQKMKYVHTKKEIGDLYDRVYKCEELLGEIFDIARSNQYKCRCSEVYGLIKETYPRWSHSQVWDLSKYMVDLYEYKNKPKGYYQDVL